MATHWAGSEGTVKFGSNAIAEVRSFSIEETSDTVDDTVMGDTYKTHIPTLKSWSGSVDCIWDETDTNGQLAATVGASVTLNVYPEGASTGDKYLSGTATITGVTVNGSYDGLVERSITFLGNGALSQSTAA